MAKLNEHSFWQILKRNRNVKMMSVDISFTSLKTIQNANYIYHPLIFVFICPFFLKMIIFMPKDNFSFKDPLNKQQQMYAIQQRLSPILGQNYRENDYSPAFHSMVNKVVCKIYHKRGRRKPIIANNSTQNIIEQQQQQNTLSSFVFNRNRKNSPNPTNRFMTPRNSKVQLFKKHQEKNRQQVPSLQKKFMRTQTNQKSQRCSTQPHNTYSLKLYQKISQYNQCLITKTFRFQQKNRQLADLSPDVTRRQHQSHLSSIFKRKPLNITTRQKGFNVRSITQEPRSCSLPITYKNEFRPWETKEADQFTF